MGTEVIKAFIVPKVRAIGERIEPFLDGAGQNADRIAASHIKQLVIVRNFFFTGFNYFSHCLWLFFTENYGTSVKSESTVTRQCG